MRTCRAETRRDLILEGADRILFMEVKRPLPGKFQQGRQPEIFSALADGMVYWSGPGALRHKIVLREQNHTLTLYADPRHEKALCASTLSMVAA